MKISEFLNETAVESTWITSLTYNRPNKILTMQLSNGKTYSIPGITRTMFERWINSTSKGRFFHDKIKDTYRSTRIK